MGRAVWRAVLILLLFLAGLASLWLLFPWWSPECRLRVKRAWSRAVIRAVGMDLRVHPAEMTAPAGRTMVVMNHVSWLDIIVLNACLPSTFVAKSEIRRWPLIGMLVHRSGTVFIERGNRHAVRHVNHEILKRFARNEVITFFPEGTTSDGRHVLPFHTSLFAMAIPDGAQQRPPATVLPVAIHYRRQGQPTLVAAYVGEQTLMASIMQVLSTSGLQVVLDVLPAVEPLEGPAWTRHAVAELAHARIAAAVAMRQSGAPS